MDLAYAYLSQSLQDHDVRESARVNERRLAAADRAAYASERAERAEHAEGDARSRSTRAGFLHRVAERMHLARADHAHGARAAH